jgi:LacI family transcriptional regulator
VVTFSYGAVRHVRMMLWGMTPAMSTLRDVARFAEVSVSTASRYLRRDGYVSPQAGQRVAVAMQQLGYRPNEVARSLRHRRTRTLALVVPEIENPFFTTVSRGVEDVANAAGYAVIFCNTDENEAKQERYLRALLERKIDGVLFVPCGQDAADQCHMLDVAGQPFVFIDREVPGVTADAIVGDNEDGARRLTQHLLALGHRRIGLVGGNPHDSVSHLRRAGYSAALGDAGVKVDAALVREGDWSTESSGQLTRDLLALDHPPTALFCTNNLLAVGALRALRDAHKRVPDDIALVCFDDIELASLIDPWLTVAVQPGFEMGLRAATLLLERLAGRSEPTAVRDVLPVRLIIRRSCGTPPQGTLYEQPVDGWIGRQWRRAGTAQAPANTTRAGGIAVAAQPARAPDPSRALANHPCDGPGRGRERATRRR